MSKIIYQERLLKRSLSYLYIWRISIFIVGNLKTFVVIIPIGNESESQACYCHKPFHFFSSIVEQKPPYTTIKEGYETLKINKRATRSQYQEKKNNKGSNIGREIWKKTQRRVPFNIANVTKLRLFLNKKPVMENIIDNAGDVEL